MPLYEIRHVCPLTAAQQDELAEAITDLHSNKFTTPRMFVQIRFLPEPSSPSSSQPSEPPAAANSAAAGAPPATYIGGKRRAGNHIFAYVRTGPSRSQAEFDALCMALVGAWTRIVPMPQRKGAAPVDYDLRSCIIVGGLTAGWEAGFVLPAAGGDIAWLREHWEEMQMRAQSGDAEMGELVEEVKSRGLLEGDKGLSSKRRLEEMLGWGDSA